MDTLAQPQSAMKLTNTDTIDIVETNTAFDGEPSSSERLLPLLTAKNNLKKTKMKITKQNRNKAKYKPSEHTIEGSEFNTYGTGLSNCGNATDGWNDLPEKLDNWPIHKQHEAILAR